MSNMTIMFTATEKSLRLKFVTAIMTSAFKAIFFDCAMSVMFSGKKIDRLQSLVC